MSNSRVWFITGSTSGFGRALVDAVRARGEQVVATARRPGALADLVGDDVHTLALDVTREEGIEPALDAAAEVAPFGIQVLIVEPGSFRTGLLGHSLRAAPQLEPYAQTVGAARAYIESEDGRQAGDPAKAAEAILGVLDAERPPLRLALGADAIEAIRAKHETLQAELARWERLARATAFDA